MGGVSRVQAAVLGGAGVQGGLAGGWPARGHGHAAAGPLLFGGKPAA